MSFDYTSEQSFSRQAMTRRLNDRLDSDRQVDCRADGKTFHGVLYNVSVTGCMLEIPMNRISQGERVHLKTDGDIRISGMVIWQNECNAGVRFDQPLHEAVVRFLGYDPGKNTMLLPTDRFGRPLPKLRGNDRPLTKIR
ncbi:PilZ domain-containing protein [Croceicoccus bisphenolivorans]|uniref:PilZ domain-containing protein n=1 Tax=Croceicoccus bisphenolivorans TaxID=1783232 RepID=UPI000B289100|nr:PilZ domain-containing protein [Croceicoccus bisphenolivorans]